MTLEEALKLLKETDATAFEAVKKELDALENKGKGVEAERKAAETAKKELEDAKTAHAAEIANKDKQIEAARAEWKADTDGFKKLYDDTKAKLEAAEKNSSTTQTELEDLRKQKADFEALVAADIEKLYEGLEEEDVKTLKSLAEKYPIQERVAFIVDFKEKYLKKGNGGKWGWPKGGSGGSNTVTMEEIQAEYDKLAALPRKTPEQMAALRKAAKYLSGELKLPTT